MLSIVKDVLTRLYAFLGGDIYYINSGEALPPPLSREEEAKIMEQLRAGDEEVKADAHRAQPQAGSVHSPKVREYRRMR